MKNLALAAAVLLGSASTALAQNPNTGHMGGYGNGYGMMGWGGGWFWGFGMFFFWIVVILAIVIAVRAIGPGGRKGDQPPAESALDVLKKRYAKGEISKDEYERIKKDIL